MRKRPPFALVLSLLVAAAAVAIVLAGQSGGHPATHTQPPTIGIGATPACVTTRAVAQAEDRSAIVVTATAQAPVVVTERASGPRGIASVSRAEVATARILADQPVVVRRAAVAQARACANSNSFGGGRTAALREAYALALSAAHAQAVRDAAGELAAVVRKQYPSVLTQARTRAEARARQLAVAAEARLSAEARAQARQRAGA
jgi:hypothetical protein